MAENTPGVKNKGLLITALVVGLIVVLLYNYQIEQVRRAGQGKSVAVLAFVRAFDAGETVDESSLKIVHVSVDAKEGLGDVVLKSDVAQVVGQRLKMRVAANHYLRFGHIQGDQGSRASANIKKGWEALTVEVDPRFTPGELLGVGDRVALMGVLAVNGKQYRIIDHVRILGVGGSDGGNRSKRATGSGGQRSYRKLTIEVPRDTVDLLSSIQTYLEGPFRVVLQGSGGFTDANYRPEVLKELRELLTAQKPAIRKNK